MSLRARRDASGGLESYFLAGRRLTALQSGLSMTATQYAADTPLLAAGLVATGGVFALWRLWIYGVAFLALGFLFGAAWWRSGVVTDAELCELRYAGRPAAWLRGLKALYYGGVFNCTVLAMVLVAAVRIAEPFLLWDRWLPPALFDPVVALVRAVGVPLVADARAADPWVRSAANLISLVAIYAFTMLYSSVGGLRSVARTDMGQLALVALGTGVYAVYAVDAVGGLAALREQLARELGAQRAASWLALDPWNAAGVSASLLAVVGVQWLAQMNADGSGYLAQRCMACRSARDARRAPVLFAFAQVLLRSLLWLPILVALLVLFPSAPGESVAVREQAFVRGISLLPAGARGLMLVGMLAALCSTLDTHLNWGASYLANDAYARGLSRGLLRREPGARELVWVARLSAPVVMALSLALMTALDSIREAWHATLLLGAGLGVPLLLRWTWWRANAWGELAAIATSAVAAPLLMLWVESEAARLLAMASLGAAATLAAARWGPPEDAARIRHFYQRVQPPGFWRDPAATHRLRRACVAVAASSASLFCALAGLASWLLRGPDPLGIGAVAWGALLLGVAVACVPVWWPALHDE